MTAELDPDEAPANIQKRIVFGEQNRMAAEIILADIEKYGGEDSAMVMWARKQVRE